MVRRIRLRFRGRRMQPRRLRGRRQVDLESVSVPQLARLQEVALHLSNRDPALGLRSPWPTLIPTMRRISTNPKKTP